MKHTTLIIAGFLVLFTESPSYSIDKRLFDAIGIQELRQMAPELVLSDLNGRKVSLKEYRGKVVFLHFWATWCKPCKEEMPTIEKMHKEFKNRDFVILAVSIDKVGTDMVWSYVKEFTFSTLLASSGRIDDSYWSWGIPVSYIIDRNGWIIGRAMGPKKWDSDALRNLIKEILKD
ncbi:MAG: TlpA disulfide reductase family protein [Nitrospirota bacterium]